MIKRRPLGSGPRPATPPAPLTAARPARLATESTPTPPPTAAADEHPEPTSGRRTHGPGTTTDR
ncbi:hypothetical protein ABT246_34965 [Streptomyces sp. NPDC001553]|uniref:hypothetical protein n=1 Tax=Streptomyces sp. NPDC001553 TaxID=3154385 RepID=UPI00331AEC54